MIRKRLVFLLVFVLLFSGLPMGFTHAANQPLAKLPGNANLRTIS
ncbi:hypothetical protein [Paenibacillus pabuli]